MTWKPQVQAQTPFIRSQNSSELYALTEDSSKDKTTPWYVRFRIYPFNRRVMMEI